MSGVLPSARKHFVSVPTDLDESRLTPNDLAVIAQYAADRVQVAAMIARTFSADEKFADMLGLRS